ncbi:hypothetical protein [Algiphilus sp.]|uniref:hypothetical protein n=2 Tax=Algiphilus sp. TaxID=1872431 RepID=UPI0025BBAE0F|nr:hypothetical protein [Algiphilus sp.]MCK5769511.1 hypothetical protein [Algiphilus sp.]
MLSLCVIVGGGGLFLLGTVWLRAALAGIAGPRLHAMLLRGRTDAVTALLAGAMSAPVAPSGLAAAAVVAGHPSGAQQRLGAATGVLIGALLAMPLLLWGALVVKPALSVALVTVAGGALLARLGTRSWVIQLGSGVAALGLAVIGIDLLHSGWSGLGWSLTALSNGTAATALVLVAIGTAAGVVVASPATALVVTLAATTAAVLTAGQAMALAVGHLLALAMPAMRAIGTVSRRSAVLLIVLQCLAAALGYLMVVAGLPDALAAVSPEGGFSRAGQLAIFVSAQAALVALLMMALRQPLVRMLVRLLPEEGHAPLTPLLDPLLRRVPAWALAAAGSVLHRGVADMMRVLARSLRSGTAPSAQEIVRNSAALDAVAAYFARLNPGSGRTDQKRLGRLRQVLDHARSLRDDLEAARRAAALREMPALASLADELADALDACADGLVSDGGLPQARLTTMETFSARIGDTADNARQAIVERLGGYSVAIETVLAQLAAQRWLERVTVHALRSAAHLRALAPEAPSEPGGYGA